MPKEKMTKEEALKAFKKALEHRKEAKRKLEEEYARLRKKVNVVLL